MLLRRLTSSQPFNTPLEMLVNGFALSMLGNPQSFQYSIGDAFPHPDRARAVRHVPFQYSIGDAIQLLLKFIDPNVTDSFFQYSIGDA